MSGDLLDGMAGQSFREVRSGPETSATRAIGVADLLARSTVAGVASLERIVSVSIAAALFVVIVSHLPSLALQQVLVHLGAVAHETEEPTWLCRIGIS